MFYFPHETNIKLWFYEKVELSSLFAYKKHIGENVYEYVLARKVI